MNFIKKLQAEVARKKSMKPVTIKLAEEDIALVEQIGKEINMTRQAILERIISDELNKYREQQAARGEQA